MGKENGHWILLSSRLGTVRFTVLAHGYSAAL